MSNISLHGNLYIGPYKGYHGCAVYDSDSGGFHGDVVETNDVITFVGRDPSELEAAFKESIDGYLEFCESQGKPPDKPFSGNFPVRATPKLHHDLTVAAAHAGTSLNAFVVCILHDAIANQRPITLVSQTHWVKKWDTISWANVEPLSIITTRPVMAEPIEMGGRFSEWTGMGVVGLMGKRG
jgi:predicted HicB family RNase H-like nuclease